jgi:hypothetical protein
MAAHYNLTVIDYAGRQRGLDALNSPLHEFLVQYFGQQPDRHVMDLRWPGG